MNNVLESRSWGLSKFKHQDLKGDFAQEAAALLGASVDDASEWVAQVLRWYHEGQGVSPSLSREVVSILIHITQPYRIPVMTVRMDHALEVLDQRKGIRTVLDYGGGGGKETIMLARAGYRVTYSDFFDSMTPLVAKRFAIRGLDITMEDVRDLKPQRYECITCMDVLEHIYDFEFSVADVVSRLEKDGILICWPALYNDWSGDDKAKNCAYNYFFEALLNRAGMRLLREDRMQGIMIFVRESRPGVDIAEERTRLRRSLYEYSQRVTMKRALRASLLFPWRVAKAAMKSDIKGREMLVEQAVSDVIDNADVYRLSRHRLKLDDLGGGEAFKS